MKAPTNKTELMKFILETMTWVRGNPHAVKQAKEVNNSAGKAIALVKLELECAALRKEKPNIAFLRG